MSMQQCPSYTLLCLIAASGVVTDNVPLGLLQLCNEQVCSLALEIRPRTSGGLDVDCLALLITAVPDTEISDRRGTAGTCTV